jgi:sec-independent protein translocase protein TatA
MFRNPLTDTLVVVLILLLFFGPKRLPALARGLGDGIREFKDSIGGRSDDEGERPALTEAQAAETAPEAQATETATRAEAGSESSTVER